jgi:hypothetical protein
MTKNILIAAPIYKREWILPLWIHCLNNQNYPRENIGFMFELGPDDDGTHEMLWDFQNSRPEALCFDAQIYLPVKHVAHADGHRNWNAEKYENMVTLRNNLLERASGMSDKFDYYFSLDSDILLEDPDTITKLVNHCEEERDVVSPLMYMTPDSRNYPSGMTWVENNGNRAARVPSNYDVGNIFKIDIVMAAVMMSRKVYPHVRYRWHRQGEDLGFAYNLREVGIQSWAAWDIYCPHIMNTGQLAEYINLGLDLRKPF